MSSSIMPSSHTPTLLPSRGATPPPMRRRTPTVLPPPNSPAHVPDVDLLCIGAGAVAPYPSTASDDADPGLFSFTAPHTRRSTAVWPRDAHDDATMQLCYPVCLAMPPGPAHAAFTPALLSPAGTVPPSPVLGLIGAGTRTPYCPNDTGMTEAHQHTRMESALHLFPLVSQPPSGACTPTRHHATVPAPSVGWDMVQMGIDGVWSTPPPTPRVGRCITLAAPASPPLRCPEPVFTPWWGGDAHDHNKAAGPVTLPQPAPAVHVDEPVLVHGLGLMHLDDV